MVSAIGGRRRREGGGRGGVVQVTPTGAPRMTEDTFRQARILVLDDDVSTLCLLKGVLGRLGFGNVQTLTRPREFAGVFSRTRPDLVITDLVMPDLDGFAIIEYIRSVEPAEVSMPVLMLTANQSAQTRRKALAAGATDVLGKPFDPSELLMRIRNVLRTRFLHLALTDHNAVLEQVVAARTRELEKALAELRESQRNTVQQERFRAFGEMASGVVHDFNNALMTVIGYSEILLADPLAAADPAQVQDYLSAINMAGRDASHVVSRLRDFYRPREECEQFEPVDMGQVLREAAKLAEPKWRTQSMNLGRDVFMQFQLERVPKVFGNPSELRESVMNLIFNAVDALPQGGCITLRARQCGAMVEFCVEDTGVGMSSEVRQRCLEPFFTTKGEYGTGLGLPMVFGIVKRHEGTIEFESAPGEGTRVVVRLPVRERAEAPPEPNSAPQLQRPLNVLVVDDEASARDIVSRYLAVDGHTVTTVSNGPEAVWHFQQHRFDLLLADQGMPGMSGVQLARHIREMRATQPIILLTGFTFDTEHLPPEINCVVRKPIAPERLRVAVAEVVNR